MVVRVENNYPKSKKIASSFASKFYMYYLCKEIRNLLSLKEKYKMNNGNFPI